MASLGPPFTESDDKHDDKLCMTREWWLFLESDKLIIEVQIMNLVELN